MTDRTKVGKEIGPPGVGDVLDNAMSDSEKRILKKGTCEHISGSEHYPASTC